MKIQLESWKIKNLSFSVLNEERSENSFDLSTGHFFTEEDKKKFGISFEITINDKEFDLNIEAVFLFKLDEDLTEEFKLSDFPKINAPAIAFPYLRAFVSNITLQSGFKPVILPSINFVSLAEKSE